jgi:hypothetical protein
LKIPIEKKNNNNNALCVRERRNENCIFLNISFSPLFSDISDQFEKDVFEAEDANRLLIFVDNEKSMNSMSCEFLDGLSEGVSWFEALHFCGNSVLRLVLRTQLFQVAFRVLIQTPKHSCVSRNGLQISQRNVSLQFPFRVHHCQSTHALQIDSVNGKKKKKTKLKGVSDMNSHLLEGLDGFNIFLNGVDLTNGSLDFSEGFFPSFSKKREIVVQHFQHLRLCDDAEESSVLINDRHSMESLLTSQQLHSRRQRVPKKKKKSIDENQKKEGVPNVHRVEGVSFAKGKHHDVVHGPFLEELVLFNQLPEIAGRLKAGFSKVLDKVLDDVGHVHKSIILVAGLLQNRNGEEIVSNQPLPHINNTVFASANEDDAFLWFYGLHFRVEEKPEPLGVDGVFVRRFLSWAFVGINRHFFFFFQVCKRRKSKIEGRRDSHKVKEGEKGKEKRVLLEPVLWSCFGWEGCSSSQPIFFEFSGK